MCVIKLKNQWVSSDSFLVVNDRMTENGLSAYWNAVDASFKFNSIHRDVYLAKQLIQKQQLDKSDQSVGRGKRKDGLHSYDSKPAHADKDQMYSFFRRHSNNNVDRHMDDREDNYSWRHNRRDDHFMLPRVHHNRF